MRTETDQAVILLLRTVLSWVVVFNYEPGGPGQYYNYGLWALVLRTDQAVLGSSFNYGPGQYYNDGRCCPGQ